MCTVSFIAREQGYLLGMNRDEKWSRPAGIAPQIHQTDGRAMVCPGEPAGGTWISLNQGGTCFALINWYAVASAVDRSAAISRGQVVRSLGLAATRNEAGEKLGLLPLMRMNPFRLIGIFPFTQEISEWRWNGIQLVCAGLPWETRQWISSGFDERTAQQVRGGTFREACLEPDAGTQEWLRRLHGSHGPARGAFSTCVHRADAGTVSYTEVAVEEPVGIMRHHNGALCEPAGETGFKSELRLPLSAEFVP